MKNSFSQVFRHAAHYLSIPLASVLLSFVSVPVLTNLMSPGDYGTLYTFLAYVAISNILLTLNFHTAVGRYWYENKEDFGEFVTTSIALAVFSIFILLFFVMLFSEELINILNFKSYYLYLIFPFAIVSMISVIFDQIYIPQRASKLIARIAISKNYLIFLTGVSFLIFLPYEKPLLMIIANLLITGMIAIYLLSKIRNYTVLKFNRANVKYIVNYTLPLLPYSLSGIFLSQVDRIMLNSYIDSSSVGFYAFAYIIANLFMIVMGALLTAWTPNFFEAMNDNRIEQLEAENKILIKIAFFVGLGVVCFGDDVARLLANEKFHEGLVIIPILVVGFLFHFLFQLYGRSLGYDKKTIWISLATICISVLNIYLNSLFIPEYGFVGAAVTTMISYFMLGIGGIIVYRMVLDREDYIFNNFFKDLLTFIIFLSIDVFFIGDILLEIVLVILYMVLIFYKDILKFIKGTKL